ncbi:hypothetical protein pb186bvf_016037 [Paramecium bursaria]
MMSKFESNSCLIQPINFSIEYYDFILISLSLILEVKLVSIHHFSFPDQTLGLVYFGDPKSGFHNCSCLAIYHQFPQFCTSIYHSLTPISPQAMIKHTIINTR